MRIVPLAGRASCRLVSQAFDSRIQISGIDSMRLRWLFGAGGSAFDWSELAGSILEIQLEQNDSGAGPVETVELDDGRLEMQSGGAARLYIESRHQTKPDRFPDSLALALGQQWARAGLCMLHAAGVVINDRGHLLLGDKGHGKSTLSASVLANGGQVVSDDWLLIGGNSRAELHMERLRGFIMLRQSWATERLQQRLEKPLWPHSQRPRLLLTSRSAPDLLPVTAGIHAVWMLQRHGGRPAQTTHRPVTPVEMLAGLISASVPLLYSRRFPLEHQRLNRTLSKLTARTSNGLLRPGLDIVEPAQPGAAHPLAGL